MESVHMSGLTYAGDLKHTFSLCMSVPDVKVVGLPCGDTGDTLTG